MGLRHSGPGPGSWAGRRAGGEGRGPRAGGGVVRGRGEVGAGWVPTDPHAVMRPSGPPAPLSVTLEALTQAVVIFSMGVAIIISNVLIIATFLNAPR